MLYVVLFELLGFPARYAAPRCALARGAAPFCVGWLPTRLWILALSDPFQVLSFFLSFTVSSGYSVFRPFRLDMLRHAALFHALPCLGLASALVLLTASWAAAAAAALGSSPLLRLGALRSIVLRHAVLCHAVLCHALLHRAILRRSVLHCASLRHAVLRHAVLCFAVLRHGVLCLAALCFATPCSCVSFGSPFFVGLFLFGAWPLGVVLRVSGTDTLAFLLGGFSDLVGAISEVSYRYWVGPAEEGGEEQRGEEEETSPLCLFVFCSSPLGVTSLVRR